LDQKIMIEGYRVPNSLVATTMPEPYRLAPPSRSMVGILMDFGVAGVVAALVALFVTGALPISWSLATNGKTRNGQLTRRHMPYPHEANSNFLRRRDLSPAPLRRARDRKASRPEWW
jgi:hypothetical protein